MKAQLLKKFQEILHEDENDHALTSGASRNLCWTGTAQVPNNPGYRSSGPSGVDAASSSTGNSANASKNARSNAKRVSVFVYCHINPVN